MTPQQDFQILQPYVLTDKDKDAINRAKSNPPHGDDWEKSCVKGFKSRFKEYTLKQQQYHYCAYCRQQIDDSMYAPEIDHIVPKTEHPKWTFEILNLCVTCPRCNTNKHTQETLAYEKVENYPVNANAFQIVHPYKDVYSKHIEILDDILYKGLTPKGKFTIDACALNDERRVQSRIRLQKSIQMRNYASIIPVMLEQASPSDIEVYIQTLCNELKNIITK